MSKTLRYFGRFVGNDNAAYLVNIWQEGTFTAEEVTFSAHAVTIQWKEADKMTAVRESTATVKLRSHSDRKFIDLYTTDVSAIRLDIYRAGALYWSGVLDTENYEEPYDRLVNYEVSLKFRDFGVLKRIDYDMKGFKTLNEIITACLQKTGINYIGIEKSISTKLNQTATSDVFDDLTALSDNFYDEDGDADKYYDVLKRILEVFSALIIQKNGRIYITDFNSLAASAPTAVTWASAESTLSVDVVYSEADVKFSIYEKTDILDTAIDDEDYPAPSTDADVSVNTAYSGDGIVKGFDIWFNATLDKKFTLTDSSAKFFFMKSVYSGSDARGVMCCCKPREMQYLSPASTTTGTELMKVKEMPYVGNQDTDKYKLKISLDFLFDVRYNPFEDASTGNEEGNYSRMKNWCNWAYVPIMITLRDAAGNAVCHFDNHFCASANVTYPGYSWKAGEASWGDAYLCYYDERDRTSSTGLGGWATNKPMIGRITKGLPTALQKLGEGDYITLPPTSGWLDVRIGKGIKQFDHDGYEEKDIYSLTRWVAYKNLGITLVDVYGKELTLKDEETKAWLDKNAEDSFDMTVHVGTKAAASPAARGSLFLSSDKSIVTSLYRAGVTDTLQRLLIGTVYSQHAARKNRLSGKVKLLPAFCSCSEKNLSGIYYIVGETQDLAFGTSEIAMTEIAADSFEGVNYE